MVQHRTRAGPIALWSTLGLFAGLGIYAIDTGAVWGGQFTAMQLDGEEPRFVAVNAESNRLKP